MDEGAGPRVAAAAGLTPAQQDVLDRLSCPRSERPVFDPALALGLRAELESNLAPLAREIDPADPLFVSKHMVAQLHGCEVRFQAEEAEEFAWSPPLARGTIAHKAIELSLNWRGEPLPGDLVEESIARLTETQSGLGDYLQRCGDGELAEISSEAGERVAAFLEGFPPLDRRWRPRPEARLRVDLCDSRITLSGKADLTLGQAEGNVAGKVIIDMKTGGFAVAHRDDLRFYALMETLKIGVPPRMVATHYLDSCRLEPEDVTEDVLEVTVARISDAITRLAELREGAEPVLRPSRTCRWCPVLDTCEPGRAAIDFDE